MNKGVQIPSPELKEKEGVYMCTTIGFADDEDEVYLEPTIQEWEEYLASQSDDDEDEEIW